MFSSKFWLVATAVLAIVFLGLFGVGYMWQGATCLLAAVFSSLWGLSVLEDEHKEANINW